MDGTLWSRHSETGQGCPDAGVSPGRWLTIDLDPEDRRRDLVADESAELLVQVERLAPELVERVLLGIAAQADAATHVVELGQVDDPQAVDRLEQDEPLGQRPVLADLALALLELGVCELAQVRRDLLAPADVPDLVLGRARVQFTVRSVVVREGVRDAEGATAGAIPASNGCA